MCKYSVCVCARVTLLMEPQFLLSILWNLTYSLKIGGLMLIDQTVNFPSYVGFPEGTWLVFLFPIHQTTSLGPASSDAA